MGFWQFCGGPSQGCGGAPRPGARGSAARAAASKPFPVRTGVPGKPGGFAAVPPRGCAPHSSSGQTALYSGRPAGEGIPHTAPLPLLFPTATASLGCSGGPRFLEKENASRPVEEKIAFCRATGPAGQLAEVRGSSESVPTRLASLLPSAEHIGCCRDCSAAARRTPAVIVGWKIARSVLLLPRIPLRYALPGQSWEEGAKLPQPPGCGSKKRSREHSEAPQHQSPATANVRQQKENGRASGRDPNFRNCHTQLSGQSPQVFIGPKPP